MNDVFIRAAIEAHRFTQTAFVCLGRNSLSRCCQLVSSRSILTAHPYTRSIGMFPWESSRKILRVIKCYSSRSRAHLTVFTERVLFQTNKSCLCKSISPFTIGHYGSRRHHVALIAASHAIARVANGRTCMMTSRTRAWVKL